MMRFHLPVLFTLTAASSIWFLSGARAAEPTTISAVTGMPTIAPADDEREYTGRITGWKVEGDGSVYVRLRGTKKSKSFELWFVTPPSQTATTEFERFVMDIVRDFGGARTTANGQAPELMVRADASDDRGKKIDDAMELISIGRF